MIRLVLGSTLPLLGLGIAVTTLGPDLLAGPRGEPMIMAASDQANLQATNLDGTACPSKLLYSDASAGEQLIGPPGTHIVALALRSGERDVAVGIEDFPAGAVKASKTVVLVFDDTGRLVAAGDPAVLHLSKVAAPSVDCSKTPDTLPRAPI